MSVYVVSVDVSEGNEAEVTNQQIVLGRTFLSFSCEDTRISRNQGLLIHKSDALDYVTIKSTHLNPIYYKVDGSANIEVLLKENEVSLRHDDQFGLLPDQCWFRIAIRGTEAASLVLRVRPVAELNDSQNFPEIIPQVTNNQHVERIAHEEATSQSDMISLQTPDFTFDGLPRVLNEPLVESSEESQEPELALAQVTHNTEDRVSHQPEVDVPQSSNEPVVAVPQISSEAVNVPQVAVEPVVNVPQLSSESEVRPVTVKREAEEVSSGSPKRQRTDNPTSSTSDDVPQGPCESGVSTTSNQPSSSSSSVTVKKEEPDSTDNLRGSCPFGIKCYRRTIEHRRELAHPGDTDYRRPNFPPAPPGSPMCPYGPRCYRRNPDHFQEFDHPPSTAALGNCSSSDGNTASTSTMPAWLPRPVRQPKREQDPEDDVSEDDDDLDFSDGDDDDDFQLNGVPQESSDEISLGSDLEESDDNSAILDDGDANED